MPSVATLMLGARLHASKSGGTYGFAETSSGLRDWAAKSEEQTRGGETD